MTKTDADNLLEVQDLQVHFQTEEGVVKAVDGASFTIPRGKTVCVVGESGCGKSVTARAILQVVDAPGRIVGGQVRFRPEPAREIDLTGLKPKGRPIRAIRGKEITMIFQEPMSSLSPMYTIGNQIIEALRWHHPISKEEARTQAIEALELVGIPRPAELIDAYTFELSGGMRQRAMIAMALVCGPKLLIADEPTTALDVTTQANILDLMRDLQQKMGMSMLFITHDLGVVAEIAHEVVVMYLGIVAEQGSVDAIFGDPKHPYTRALLRSIPRIDSAQRDKLDVIRGTVPHPLNRPAGCPFQNRCDFAVRGTCDVVVPKAIQLEDGRAVRCHAYDPAYAHLVTLEARPTVGAAGHSRNAAPQRPTDPNSQPAAQPLLEVKDLKMHFPITTGFFNRITGHVKAVDGVSFEIYPGETLGLVGESGCGKTTLGHSLVRLYKPNGGEIRYAPGRESAAENGAGPAGQPIDLARFSEKELKPYRRDIRMIFQDPFNSLNPRLPVLEIIGEVLKVNGIAQGSALERRVSDLMERVGLSREYLHRYPHAFSGGQRQRISIARALAPEPKLVVADEPVSALDVSVQAQILNLLKMLQQEFGLTYLFISHDLSVVAYISDRVAVMYTGRIVELAATDEIFHRPLHPYTEALLSAVLRPDPSQKNNETRIRLGGRVADPANLPGGCAFHPRCRYAVERCTSEVPALRELTTGHQVACHLAEELELRGIEMGYSADNV